ncbi:hypothetical protein ANN_20303 [Periplaneta americana]|uniref:Uncharacterized protein n=1 Tax=Periplaneta americana TaxID=6978 RepID=A0ABQ8SCZ7_PERAM|nr:hypothetical protein ANN_20303 [Periplaneta americana]
MPSTWPRIEPATFGIEGQRYTNSPIRSTMYIIAKYIRQAQTDLMGSVRADTSPLLETLLLTEHIHPDDVLTIVLDMFLIGVNAVSVEFYIKTFTERRARFNTGVIGVLRTTDVLSYKLQIRRDEPRVEPSAVPAVQEPESAAHSVRAGAAGHAQEGQPAQLRSPAGTSLPQGLPQGELTVLY